MAVRRFVISSSGLLLLLLLPHPVRGFLVCSEEVNGTSPEEYCSGDPIQENPLLTIQNSIPLLNLGESTSHEIKGGETHIYTFTLATGQYARVIVQRRAIDLVVSILNPAQQQLIETSNPAGNQGPVSSS